MKPIKITVIFLIVLTICVQVRADNYSNYLKTGLGTYLINDKFGPAYITEFGHSLNQNLFIVPKFIKSVVIDENKSPKYSTYNSYYDFGLGLQYQFPSMDRLGLGFGGNLQIINKIYLREYEDINNSLVRNIANTFDLLYGFYCSLEYTVLQGKNIDFGVNGIAQFGEYSSFSVLIHMRFKV